MKIIKTLLALLFIQSIAVSQTVADAKKSIESEFYFKAKKTLLAINNSAPTAESNYYLGNIYLLTENPDSAKYYYKKASEFVDNKNPLIYVAAGKLNLLNNKGAEAKESFNSAIKVSKSKNAEIFFQIGDAYYKIDNNEAIKYYELAYSTDPSLVINLLAYGDAYLQMAKPGEAMTKYEQARTLNPNIAVVHLRIGRVNAKTGKHKEAIEAFEKTVALDPELAVAWKELGEEYYLEGGKENKAKVRNSFEKYLALNAEDKESRIVPAATCYEIGDYECALEQARKIVADEPSNFIAWRIIYYANYELGDSLRKTDALQSTEKFNEGYQAVQTFWNISEKKIKPLDYQYSARLAVELKDTAKAVFYYTMATTTDSTTPPEIFSEYAKYLYTTKKFPEAIAAYADLVNDSVAGPLDYFYLGRAYFQTEDYVNADTIFAQFIAMQPNSLDGYWQRARTQVRIEGVDVKGGALPFYAKYIELAQVDTVKNKKNLVDAYLYNTVYYNSIKEDAKACEFFAMAKALDPENELIKQIESSIVCK